MSDPRLALALVLLLSPGCASEHRRHDEEQMRQCQRGAFGVRATATALAAALSAEADALGEARKARKEDAAELAALRMKDGLALLELLEEAELTFDYAQRFYDLHDTIEAPPKVLAHLEADVGRMIDLAGAATVRAVEFAKARAGWSAGASGRLRREIERDRDALKVYRTDLGLSSSRVPGR